MAHQTHQSIGIILAGAPYGESHRFCSILTREFGLVRAVARSAREHRSKLRSNLQDWSVATFSLVKGKEVWRITGAIEQENLYYELRHEAQKLEVLGRLSLLVLRLIQGEERNSDLFDALQAGIASLKTSSSQEELLSAECVTVGRMLYWLGYMPEHHRLSPLVMGESGREVPLLPGEERRALIGLINQSLSATHL